MPRAGLKKNANNSLINRLIFKISLTFYFGKKMIDVSIFYRM